MATKTFPIVSAGTLPKVLLVFLVGGFGGIAPTMLRIGVDLSQRHGSVAEINGSILLGMAIFFIMGGAVAAIWNEVDLKKVFYIGLGLPSLITVATSTATAPQATAELLPKTTSVVAMSNLRFQTVSQNGRLEILLPPEVGYSGAVVIFYGSGSPVTVPINAGSEINVPDQDRTQERFGELADCAPTGGPERSFIRVALRGRNALQTISADRCGSNHRKSGHPGELP